MDDGSLHGHRTPESCDRIRHQARTPGQIRLPNVHSRRALITLSGVSSTCVVLPHIYSSGCTGQIQLELRPACASICSFDFAPHLKASLLQQCTL
ncbi:hypothetical protein CBOM_07771 [Ceraceosorus bombacis]|uniref:Uncharacterized protein n=1 Tax=Ceraceosorus bombacis TaxID=401625 RepID=A0A0P1BNA3_9BASI|nr:hypothetical protein CBOM_07771 [Ceraceosorus bombacis]